MTHANAGALDADVVIVGGGLAGLTAAVGLQREGVDVVVVERDRRLGGRAQSWVDETTGDPVHIGPHIFLTEYPNMFKLLDLLGTRDKIVWEDEHFIVLAHGQRHVVQDQHPLPAPFHFAPTMMTDPFSRTRDKLSNFLVTLYAMQMDERDVMRLDGVNAYAFLRRMGVTKSYIEQFWSFASMAIMNVPIEVCSAGALMRFFQKFIGYNQFSFGFPDGGLGELFAPGARRLVEDAGGQVRLQTEVQRLIVDGGRVGGVELTDGTRILARHTIAAVPPQVLRHLGPRRWKGEHEWYRDLVHFHPCPYVSVFLWFDEKITDLRMWARTHAPDDLNCDFYDLSNIHTGWRERPSVVCSNIIYCHRADGMSDEEIVRQTVAEIAEAHPKASMDKVDHWVVNRIPMAIHCPFPGTERRRPPTDVGVDGLVLAGDFVRTELPSSMESAVCSGWMAAEQVLAELGQPQTLHVAHRELEGLTGLVRRGSKLLPTKGAQTLMHTVRRVLDDTDFMPRPRDAR